MSDQTSPEQPRDTRSWPARHKIITTLGVIVVGGIIAASIGSGSSSPTPTTTPTITLAPAAQPTTSAPAPASSTPASSPSATGPATQPNPAPQHVVEYVVTGSTADVTYGPIGSSYAGASPMHKRVSLDSTDAIGYSVSAQLQGGGSVECRIVIDGKTVASAGASGGYNIAICETVKDPFTGEWHDANKS